MTYPVLSIDGGGILGVVPLTILKRLSVPFPQLIDRFKLLAGTSTGGIISLMLASGHSVDETLQLYVDHGAEIFDTSWARNVFDLDGLLKAKYSNVKLANLIFTYLGTRTLDELDKRVLVPAFNLDNGKAVGRSWQVKFFHNFPSVGGDGEELAYHVALRTSAAPTYFPSSGTYIDGGVFCNNPAMAALCQTQDSRNTDPNPVEADIRLFSLGTGDSLRYIEGKDHDWGIGEWAKPITGVMMSANQSIADYQCRQRLGKNYLRLAPVFPEGVTMEMDDYGDVQKMIDFANAVDLTDVTSWIQSWI